MKKLIHPENLIKVWDMVLIYLNTQWWLFFLHVCTSVNNTLKIMITHFELI